MQLSLLLLLLRLISVVGVMLWCFSLAIQERLQQRRWRSKRLLPGRQQQQERQTFFLAAEAKEKRLLVLLLLLLLPQGRRQGIRLPGSCAGRKLLQ